MAEGVSASSLQAAFIELASIVRALHGDWSAPADGYEGWSCHDLLAHLSSSEAALPAVVVSSTKPPRPGAEPFDADSPHLLHEHTRGLAVERDLRTKCGGRRAA